MTMYSKIGESILSIAAEMPSNCDVVMIEMRPCDDLNYVSTSDGLWIIAPLTREEQMLVGIPFTNPDDDKIYHLSATKDDMFGLSSVSEMIASGFVTNFYFENETIIEISSSNFEALKEIWIPFRASFF